MKTVAVVTARGGSKSIPQKNIAPVAGKPLIAWTIEAARESRALDRLVVSTDNEQIADVARAWGAEVPFLRPAELAQDDSSHIDVVVHAIQWIEEHNGICPDYILLLQPTSPLRSSEDIDSAIDIAKKHNAVAVVSVSETHDHPYLTKRILDDQTLADFVSAEDIPYLRRQALPPAYALNGAIYINRRLSLLDERTFLPKGTYAYVMPRERSLDIDTPWDLYLADMILKDRMRREGH